MSDAIPLPTRPDLDQYKTLAKEILRATTSGDAVALHAWFSRWPDKPLAARLARAWEEHVAKKGGPAEAQLADAQFFLARSHGFASWPKFRAHLDGLARAGSPASRFERAADAVVAGDRATLERLLRDDPGLVRARSDRDHRSTLLHYVSANGVEDFRQKSPRNIVEIATLLLNAGADVNAESGAYGGSSTTLGLVATSWPPEEARVQIQLMELLLARGAILDGPGGGAVVGCLANGRGEAAEFLARRGAPLDFESAAGVGRLDVVRAAFASDGSLRPPATPERMHDAFAWACQFGRTDVVNFLLTRAMPIEQPLRHHGQTGLHWAALGGHADIVRLLLEKGARVDARDERFRGTPLEWALYGWRGRRDAAGFHEVVALLAQAGAGLDAAWFHGDADREAVFAALRADHRMMEAIGLPGDGGHSAR